MKGRTGLRYLVRGATTTEKFLPKQRYQTHTLPDLKSTMPQRAFKTPLPVWKRDPSSSQKAHNHIIEIDTAARYTSEHQMHQALKSGRCISHAEKQSLCIARNGLG